MVSKNRLRLLGRDEIFPETADQPEIQDVPEGFRNWSFDDLEGD